MSGAERHRFGGVVVRVTSFAVEMLASYTAVNVVMPRGVTTPSTR